MFSRNRSAQLLEQPLLSRFAADLRRRTRAFAYKPPTKFTIPRHVEPSQRKTFIAPVSSGKTEGEIPLPIAGFQNRTFMFHRLAPFPSLASGEHHEAFALVPGTCAAIATKKGMSERETTNAPTKLRRKERRRGLKKKECRGASSLFVRRNEEKPGAFAE